MSSPEPFRLDGFNVSRTFRTHSDVGLSMADAQRLEFHRGRGRRSTAPYAGYHPDLARRHRYNSDSVCPSNRFFSFVNTGSAPSSPQKLWGFAARRSTSGGNNGSREKSSYVQDAKGTSYSVSNASEPGFPHASCSSAGTSKGKSTMTKLFRSKQTGSEVSTSSTDSSSKQTQDDSIDQHPEPQQDKPQQQYKMHSDITKSPSSQASLSPSSSAHHKTSSTSCLPSPRRRKSIGEKLKDVHQQHPHTCSEDTSTSSHLLKRTTKANFMKKHSLDTTLTGLQLYSPTGPNSSHRTRSGTNPQPHPSSSSSFTTSTSSSQHTTSPPSPSSPLQLLATCKSNESVGAAAKISGSVAIARPSWATPAFTQTVVESEPSSPVVGGESQSHSAEPGSQSPTLSLSPPSPVNHSTSDISVHVKTEEDSRSQSVTIVPKVCTGNSCTSLSSLTQSSFLATSADYFRSSGHWKSILEHRDYWSRKYSWTENK